MKIYALRDRMLDYFLNPFAAPADTDVLGSISNLVNAGDMSGLAQAPHHFEVWRLGEVTVDGNIVASKELLAEAHSLIRPKAGKGELGPRPNGGTPLPKQEVSPRPAESSPTQVS